MRALLLCDVVVNDLVWVWHGRTGNTIPSSSSSSSSSVRIPESSVRASSAKSNSCCLGGLGTAGTDEGAHGCNLGKTSVDITTSIANSCCCSSH